MNQAQQFAKKHLKLLIALVVVLIGAFGVYKYISTRPVDVTADLKPTFSGYNGRGTLHYDNDKVASRVGLVIMEKNGISKADATTMLAHKQVLSKYQNTKSGQAQLKRAYTEIQAVEASFSQEDNLSNGDTVVLTVKAPKDSRIKSIRKKFKVSGLKKMKHLTPQAIMGKNKPKFVGINGFGSISPSRSFDRHFTQTSDPSHTLKNGDEMHFELDEDYLRTLQNHGTDVLGGTDIVIKVSGLTDLSAATDWKKIEGMSEARIKKYYTDPINAGDYQYTVAPVATYIGAEAVNYDPDSLDAANIPRNASFFTVMTFFKVTENNAGSIRTMYEGYGYRTVPFYDGKLDTSSLTDEEWSQDTSDTLASAVEEFKSYYDSVQKVPDV